jgi:hypothetical protein
MNLKANLIILILIFARYVFADDRSDLIESYLIGVMGVTIFRIQSGLVYVGKFTGTPEFVRGLR